MNLLKLEPALLLAFKLREARAFRVLRVVREPLKNKALDVERVYPSGFDRFLEAKQVRRVKKPKEEEEAAGSWVTVEGLCIVDRWESVCLSLIERERDSISGLV